MKPTYEQLMQKPSYEDLMQKPSYDELMGPNIPSPMPAEGMFAYGDPEAPLELKEPGPVAQVLGKGAELTEKILRPGYKGLGYGFGAIAYPFKSVTHAIATPLTAALKARAKTVKERGESRTPGFKLFAGGTPEETAREWKETWPAIKTGFASFKHFKGGPKEAKTLIDFYDSYWRNIAGTEPPKGYATVAGIGTEFAIVPQIVGTVLKTIGAGVSPIIGAAMGKRVPDMAAYKQLQMTTRAEIGGRQMGAEELGKTLAGSQVKQIAKHLSKKYNKNITPAAVKLRLGQIIRGSVTQQETLQKTANPIMAEFAATSAELKRLGILGKETYLTKLPKKRIAELFAQKGKLEGQVAKLKSRAPFPGRAGKVKATEQKIGQIADKIQQSYRAGSEKYLPRLYQTKEVRKGGVLSWLGKKIRAPYAKARKDIPFEARKAMGEIKQPAYPVAKRLAQTGTEIELGRMYETIAKNEKWSSAFWRKGMAKTPLPAGKGYGALAGKYVSPGVYNDIKEINRIRSNVERVYDTAIGTWKLGKVVWNPATHFRNKISNKVLLDMSGMGYGEQAKYAAKAFRHYKANTKDYQLAKKHFARTTVVRGELFDDILRTSKEAENEGIGKIVSAVNKSVTRISKKPAAMYQHEEFINKFMKYLQMKDKGATSQKAIAAANKWLFDYGDLAAWEKNIARRIMPFYTFPRKALPRVAEAMAVRPHTIAKYPLMAHVMTNYSLNKLELSEKDYAQIQKTLPDYMKNGSYVLMPYRDDNGDLRFFDWTYIVPWGEIAEVQERGPLKSVVTNPIVQVVGDIQRNKASWSGQEIWKETDTPREKYAKQLLYTWQAAAPSLAYKGIYWDKLSEAVMGRPLKSIEKDKFRLLPETVAHTIFGLRTQAIDPQRQQMFYLYDKKSQAMELGGKMRDVIIRLNSGNIEQKEYEKLMKQYTQQIERLLTEDE